MKFEIVKCILSGKKGPTVLDKLITTFVQMSIGILAYGHNRARGDLTTQKVLDHYSNMEGV